MKKLSKVLCLVLSFVLGLSVLTSCGGAKFDAAGLVKGNLDLVYLNQYTDEYLELVTLTADEAQATYDQGIEVEVGYFAEAFGIDLTTCDPSVKQELTSIYQQLYSHSKYEVGEATETETGYEVAVTIYPIDTMYLVITEDCDAFIDEWSLRNTNGEFSGMEQAEYENLWAQSILDLVKARMDQVGHMEPQTITVKVALDESECYVIDDADFQTIDSLIIQY